MFLYGGKLPELPALTWLLHRNAVAPKQPYKLTYWSFIFTPNVIKDAGCLSTLAL